MGRIYTWNIILHLVRCSCMVAVHLYRRLSEVPLNLTHWNLVTCAAGHREYLVRNLARDSTCPQVQLYPWTLYTDSHLLCNLNKLLGLKALSHCPFFLRWQEGADLIKKGSVLPRRPHMPRSDPIRIGPQIDLGGEGRWGVGRKKKSLSFKQDYAAIAPPAAFLLLFCFLKILGAFTHLWHEGPQELGILILINAANGQKCLYCLKLMVYMASRPSFKMQLSSALSSSEPKESTVKHQRP